MHPRGDPSVKITADGGRLRTVGGATVIRTRVAETKKIPQAA